MLVTIIIAILNAVIYLQDDWVDCIILFFMLFAVYNTVQWTESG